MGKTSYQKKCRETRQMNKNKKIIKNKNTEKT